MGLKRFGFEEIVQAIEDGGLLKRMENPSKNHPGQGYFVVLLNDYTIGVPFVEEDGAIFLKTAYRSRKLNRRFLEN